MARFSVEVADQAPLLVQIKSIPSGYCSVFAAQTAGQNASGSTSRPVLYRPSAPGVGTGQIAEIRGRVPGETPASECLTSFTSSPSLPTVNVGSFNLPIRVSWMTDPINGIIISNGGALALYQAATGGHVLNGGLSWEEA